MKGEKERIGGKSVPHIRIEVGPTKASLCPCYHLRKQIVQRQSEHPKVMYPETGKSGNVASADLCSGILNSWSC